MRTLVVTGATGYIGRALLAVARRSGWSVVAASRQPCEDADGWLGYELAVPPMAAAFPTNAPIVHLAAMTRGEAPDVELAAARALLAVAAANGSPFVFVSSQVARGDAPTAYGRTKHAIERLVLAAGGIVVRPGLVWGGAPGGVYATLLRASRKALFWPAIVPSPCVQPVHVDDLAQALLRAAGMPQGFAGRVLHVGEDAPVRFDEWMRGLAASRSHRLRTVPVPAALVRAGAAVAGRLGASPVAARVWSLLGIPRMATGIDLAELGVTLRSSRAAFAEHERRRALLREGTALMGYVLAERPALPLVRRYARAVEALHGGRPLEIPRAFLRIPALLRVLDQPGVRAADVALRERLHAATAIAEASPQGAVRFVASVGGNGRASRLAAAVGSLGSEAVARVASVPFALLRAARR